MSDEKKFYRIDAATSTVVFMAERDRVPEILYWGLRLENGQSLSDLDQFLANPIPHGSADERIPLSLQPEASRGFLARPGISIHRNSRLFTHELSLTGVESKPNKITFYLSDQHAQIEQKIVFCMDYESELLQAQSSIKNTGDENLFVDAISCPCLPVPASFDSVLTLYGRWGAEFQTEQSSLSLGSSVVIENRSGRTSHEHFPGLVIGRGPIEEYGSPLLGIHFAWSGNYRIAATKLSQGSNYLQAEELFLPGELSLKSGETYETPWLFATSCFGLTEMSQRFHKFLRKRNLRDSLTKTRPVLCNSWEAVYFDHDWNKLKKLIDGAAALGIERFVLDDGWFLGRRHDRAGLGDWQVDPDVYPQGLNDLVSYVRSRGLSFGLWVEPEMVNPDSNLYRNHPDWVLHSDLYVRATERNQLVLDLSREPVHNYLLHSISSLVKKYQIDYLKWDMNRSLVHAVGGDGRASAHKQVLAYYDLMSKLLKIHPNLEIESCSSGGGRADYRVLEHATRIWTSDNNDPLSRVDIQRGFSLFFPPEVMGCHIGDDRAHLTNRKSDIHFRAIVALQGQLGFETNVGELEECELEILRKYVEIYKKNRNWIESSSIFRVSAEGRPCVILGYVSQDQNKSLWWILTKADTSPLTSSHFCPRGLDSEKDYVCSLESFNLAALAKTMKQQTSLLNEQLEASGDFFMKVGIRLPTLNPESGMLISINSKVGVAHEHKKA